jgi:hypothetical protein
VQANNHQQPANASQVNDNARQQAPAAPAAPQQRRHDDQHHANRIRARDLLRDFERDGHEVYNSPQTNLAAAHAALTISKILWRYDTFKPTFMSPLHISKKEALDTADSQQVPTPGVDQNVLANDVAARVPLSQWLKRDEVKTK